MERIKKILSKYPPGEAEMFQNTVDMLCNKGIPNGCYQDMTVLMDVLSVLTICEDIIKKGGEDDE